MDKRDSLAKCLFSFLFQWLVDRLNDTIAGSDTNSGSTNGSTNPPSDSQRWGFIGVLDIYGFEMFEHNSFEQVTMNNNNNYYYYYYYYYYYKHACIFIIYEKHAHSTHHS
jgi:myosin heavy subunit